MLDPKQDPIHDISQPISHDVLQDTYLQPAESTRDDVRGRIARALAEAEPPGQRPEWAARFLKAQRDGFVPAGRIAAYAGTAVRGTMASCFVQPLADAIRHPVGDVPSIYAALGEAAETLRMGGGVGIDFSPIRPQGARVAGTDTLAAGPVAFMRLFDASCELLGAGAARRGAQMAVMRCDHPDIEAFVKAKAGGNMATVNLSVAISDAFMQALEAGAEVELVHAAEPGAAQVAAGAVRRADGRWVYRRVPARALWEGFVRHAHERGEPGVLFIDRINRDNNLAYCEHIAATNPCGEEPLPPYGGCCLGSVDLTRLVESPFEPTARLATERLAEIVPVAVRMLDDVLELTTWPLPAQRRQALGKRRIGLGFTGLGDALVMLGLHYGSAAARTLAAEVARQMRDLAYAASVALARERGPFPLFDAVGVLREGSFASRLPEALRRGIREHGLRNSHLLSIAPAGSVTLAFADNASSGIEPAFAWSYLRHRRRRLEPGVIAYEVEDHAWRLYQRLKGSAAAPTEAFVTAMQLSPQDHLAMLAAVAPYIDAGISKTVNAPPACPYAEFEALYRQAWRSGLKGLTAFRPSRVLGSVLQLPAAVATPCHA